MNNFVGVRNVIIVDVVEGEGTPEDRSRVVSYIYDLAKLTNSQGGLIGKLDSQSHKHLTN